MTPIPKIHEVAEHILALVPDWQTDDLGGIRYLEGGYGNHNYYFRHRSDAYAIRIPFADQPYVDRERERAIYEKLPAGLATTVVAIDVATGIMITHWLEGVLLVDRPNTTTEQLAAFVTRLHADAPTEQRDYDPHALARVYLSRTEAPKEISSIVARPWTPPELTNCHNDLNPWNVVITEDTWKALDWEFAGRNDPLFDVVNLVEGLALPMADLVDVATQVLGNRPSEQRLLACYQAFWLREYAWAQHQLDIGNDRLEIREQVHIAYDKLRHRSI